MISKNSCNGYHQLPIQKDLGEVHGQPCDHCGKKTHLVINSMGFYDFQCIENTPGTPVSKSALSLVIAWSKIIATSVPF